MIPLGSGFTTLIFFSPDELFDFAMHLFDLPAVSYIFQTTAVVIGRCEETHAVNCYR